MCWLFEQNINQMRILCRGGGGIASTFSLGGGGVMSEFHQRTCGLCTFTDRLCVLPTDSGTYRPILPVIPTDSVHY